MTLVTTLAASMLWRQRGLIEVEASERVALQARWTQQAVTEAAIIALQQDLRQGISDHLGEPWTVPLEQTPLGQVLMTDPPAGSERSFRALLADAQAKFNLHNLHINGRSSPEDLESFRYLASRVGLSASDAEAILALMVDSTVQVDPQAMATGASPRLVTIQRWSQLSGRGVSDEGLVRLEKAATLLPRRTPVNVNTAEPLVLSAILADVEADSVQRLIEVRRKTPFDSVSQVMAVLALDTAHPLAERISVSSSFFELRVTIGASGLESTGRTLLERSALGSRAVWHERIVNSGASLSSLRSLQAP
jgi:general secretion pathway protein K